MSDLGSYFCHTRRISVATADARANQANEPLSMVHFRPSFSRTTGRELSSVHRVASIFLIFYKVCPYRALISLSPSIHTHFFHLLTMHNQFVYNGAPATTRWAKGKVTSTRKKLVKKKRYNKENDTPLADIVPSSSSDKVKVLKATLT